MGKRTDELDFAKGVLIVLMVVFHLSWFGDMYPSAKQFVYAFHMPGFLMISGFVLNVDKRPADFFHTLMWIFVPYAVMETGYVLMSAFLPVRETVDNLSLSVWLGKLLFHPMGPYWYLHTLLLCSSACYAGVVLGRRIAGETGVFALTAIALLLLVAAGWVGMANALYFVSGALLRYWGSHTMIRRLPVTPWTWLPVAILMIRMPENLDKATLGGVALTLSVLLSLFWCCRTLPGSMRRPVLFVGRNTLPVLLFSPLFTLMARCVLPLFSFDSTAFFPMLLSTASALAGSFFIAWLMDRMCVSIFFFGRKTVLNRSLESGR